MNPYESPEEEPIIMAELADKRPGSTREEWLVFWLVILSCALVLADVWGYLR